MFMYVCMYVCMYMYVSSTELRSLNKPPAEIQELMEAVIIITKGPMADLSWTKGAKRLMANLDRFKELLLDFSETEGDSETLLAVLAGYTGRKSFNEDHFCAVAVTAVSGSNTTAASAGMNNVNLSRASSLGASSPGVASSPGAASGEVATQLCKWVKGVER